MPIASQRKVEAEREAAGGVPPLHVRRFPSSRPSDREHNPIPFGPSPGPLRLFGHGLGDQAGWFLALSLFGLIALALWLYLERRPQGPPAAAPSDPADGDPPSSAEAGPFRTVMSLSGRRDPRVATTIVLGGWLLTEWVILSASKGIVHPYYMSAIAPGAAAMAGAGAVAMAKLAAGRTQVATDAPAGQLARLAGVALWGAAVAGTVATEAVLLHREHYMNWFVPLLLVGSAGCLLAIALGSLLRHSRSTAAGSGLALLLLLAAPAAYASTTWLAPVEGTFPAAGPRQAAGHGGLGVNTRDLAIAESIQAYVEGHGATKRFALLTDAADTASPYILRGMRASAMAGYSGVDPALDGPGLARLVAHHQARYVLLGGEYSSRGGNGATQAVIRACRELIPAEWNSPVAYPFGLVLFDCAGRERGLGRA